MPPPRAIKGDHTIIASNLRTIDVDLTSSRCRTSGRASTSPKPASPTNTTHASSHIPRTKTPPPLPSSRTGASTSPRPASPRLTPIPPVAPVSERRSPKSVERHSPTTPAKSVSTAVETSVKINGLKGHTRSLSASTTPTPMQSSHMSGRVLDPRSKSQNSHERGLAEALVSRVGAEARRPEARRPEVPAVETREIATQTDADAHVGRSAWSELGESLDPSLPALPSDEPIAADDSSPRNVVDVAEGFLSQQIRMQAELEMVLRSHMELIAEHEGTAMSLTTASVGTGTVHKPSAMHKKSVPASLRPVTRGKAVTGCEPDVLGEDDEVRSLSLSEDGPVIRRTVSEPSACVDMHRRAAAAPDPIAMLTDGTLKVCKRVNESGTMVATLAGGPADGADDKTSALSVVGGREGVGCGASAVRSDGSTHNCSDQSNAPTHANGHAIAASRTGQGKEQSPPPDALLHSLIPILGKATGQPAGAQASPGHQLFEVVQEPPGVFTGAMTSHTTGSWSPAARRHVPALHGHALDLSQIRLSPRGDASDAESDCACRPRSARSDVSFGSAQSAFTSWSSSSRSSSSNKRQGLKATVSMPVLR